MCNLHGEVGYEGSLWKLDLKGKLLRRVCAVQDNAVDPSVRIARNNVRIYVKLLVDYRSIILGLSQRDCRERKHGENCQKHRESSGHIDAVGTVESPYVGVADHGYITSDTHSACS